MLLSHRLGCFQRDKAVLQQAIVVKVRQRGGQGAGRGEEDCAFPYGIHALDCPSQPNFLAEATEKCHWLSASLLSTWVKMSGKPWKTYGLGRVKRKEAILRAALPLPSSFGACKQLEKVNLQTYVVFGCTVAKSLGKLDVRAC